MSWTLLLGIVFVLGLAFLATVSRRLELRRMRRAVGTRETEQRLAGTETLLAHPVVDLTRCLGCGTCVASCPEEGVLELVHGQAAVVRGARCRGHSACERECPVGAITVTIANIAERDDIPAISEDLEAVGAPGLFLAGEVTAHTLIKTAVEHGTAVASEVARRVRAAPTNGNGESNGVLDLCIVGAGPAGLACSLEAKRQGLDFVTIDQEETLGGTVAKYPRRKLVMSQPVDLPLYGRLDRTEFTKEELIGLWRKIAHEQALPIQGGVIFEGLADDGSGAYRVDTDAGFYTARHVCLALGRRGVPRRLGVPGEELSKVAYSLLDARSFQGRQILVVGGGDSAVEAAMGLAEQPGNRVTLSYRKEGFFRINTKNAKRLAACLADGRLQVVYQSEVRSIQAGSVELAVQNGTGARPLSLPNDDVFIMAGGTTQLDLLTSAGVSFDPALRQSTATTGEVGTGLVKALGAGFALSVLALAWALWHSDYYLLPVEQRPAHPKHLLLRPGMNAGLGLGLGALTLVALNLLYLLRRSARIRWGSLQVWMTSHVATGILAFLCAMMHSAMAPRATAGGYALWALVVLLLTGAIGRYFYAYVPRAANGRELELDELKARLARLSEGWDQEHGRFGEEVRAEVTELIERKQWRASFPGRVLALLGVRRELKKLVHKIEERGRAEGIAEDQLQETLALARRGYSTALMAAHYEDLRALLNSWRFVHRWVALLMILLVIIHIVLAMLYGSLFVGGG